jgi:hypothetical protein
MVTVYGALVAGSGSSGDGGIMAWVVIVALAVGGLSTLYLWPYARCRKCDGGKIFSALGDGHWRTCPRCSGSGKRMRTGRQVIGLVSKADKSRGLK